MAPFSTAARAWLGSLFIYSAGLKLAHYNRAGSLVREYDMLPKPLATIAGFALPWAELLTAMSLLLARLYPLGPLLGASLGTSFAFGSFHVLRRKADVPCGCTGKAQDRVDRTTLMRALAITSCSLLVLRAHRHNDARLPLVAVVAASSASVLPGGLALYQRVRHARLRKERLRRTQHMVVKATELLATPLPERHLSGPADEHRVAQVASVEA